MNDEFVQWCDKSIAALEDIAYVNMKAGDMSEYRRLHGKAEGVRLAKGKYIEMKKEGLI